MNIKYEEIIKRYELQPHPEGGYFCETYRSSESVQTSAGDRNYATGIYFLIPAGKHSWWHRIKSDEMWHFYLGDPLAIFEISPEGVFNKTILGKEILGEQLVQYTVPAGHWFGARPAMASENMEVAGNTSYSFVGCTVSPGFDFQDFELADEKSLITQYPSLEQKIKSLKL